MVLLCGFTCTSTSRTASSSPSSETSAQSSPTTSPTSSATGGNTESPASSPTTGTTTSPLAITSLPLHGGEVGIGYGVVNLGAGGGKPPYSWSLSGGSLPAGLNLSGGGQVSGTPQAAGKPSFTVTVSDSAGGSASAPASINIVAPMGLTQPCASLCNVEQGCTVCGNFGGISGGQGPFAYTITNDNRPTGMGVSGLNLTGAFPPPGGGLGAYNLTVTVRDAYGAQGTVNANWFVFSHITFSGGAIKCPWTGCTVQFPYSGGTPGGAVSASIALTSYSQSCVAGANCPPPPHTPSASAGGGVVTITISRPANDPAWSSNGWTGTLAVVLTDTSLCGPGTAKCNTGKVTIPITVIAG